jgi:hypothetical protein
VKVLRRLFALASVKRKINTSDDSFAGEYKYLRKLTAALGLEHGLVLDIAASDGYSQSSTLGFFSEGWAGLAIEMDPNKFSHLAFLYSEFPRVKLAKNRVTPNNIVHIFDAFEIPHSISILNLDIDSYDLAVLEAILKNNYRPKIISMEINEKIPPGIYFSVNYSEDHYWKGDHFYGCSLDAAAHLVKPFGYSLVSLEYNNAFFVLDNLAAGVLNDLNSAEAFALGYQNQSDRKSLFPWNDDVESWLFLSPGEALESIKQKYEAYDGLYTILLTAEIR